MSRYNVYRDGVCVARNLFDLAYIDNNVRPGETHSYAVSAENWFWPGGVESALYTPTDGSGTATALAAAPAPVAGKVQITKVITNDDSAVVFFQPVPGAVDYRMYDASNPSKVKYAGARPAFTNPYDPATPYSIEWNGIDPTKGTTLVVQALDKLGSFQTMDGMLGPGSMGMAGMTVTNTNGQGDPSDAPNVLCASDPFPVACAPVTLSGTQAFFDNFRGEQALTPTPGESAGPGAAGPAAAGLPVHAEDQRQMGRPHLRGRRRRHAAVLHEQPLHGHALRRRRAQQQRLRGHDAAGDR